MKKWIKGFTITGIVLLCAGTGVTAFAGAGGGIRIISEHTGSGVQTYLNRVINRGVHGWDRTGGYTGRELPESSAGDMVLVASYTDVRELKVEGNYAAVRVVENPKLTNEVVIYEKSNQYGGIEHSLENGGKVRVEYYSDHHLGGHRDDYAEGIIEIPSGYTFRKAKFEAYAGTMEIPEIHAEELELYADAGTLEAEGSVLRELKAETNAGTIDLTLEGKQTDYNYRIETDLGTVQLGADEYSGMDLEKRISNGASVNAELECSVGTVTIHFEEN